MLRTIKIGLIDDNPFNSRIEYPGDKVQILASSLRDVGLLSPIRLRKRKERFEVIYGHNRVRAARLLGWKRILAEVRDCDDQQMAVASLVENIVRNDLSDYEKAICFRRLHMDFEMTFEKIGELVGYTKQHVSHHVQMLHLFDEDTLSNHPDLKDKLTKISEHHARLLLQIEDPSERMKLLDLVMRENLTVRDLQRIISKLRGWFSNSDHSIMGISSTVGREDADSIERAIRRESELHYHGDYKEFSGQHAFGPEFSLFSAYPPMQLLEGRSAEQKAKDWFFSVAPLRQGRIRDLRIRFFSKVALATFYVDYSGKHSKLDRPTHRASVMFYQRGKNWKIVHEHWSPLEYERQFNSEIAPGIR